MEPEFGPAIRSERKRLGHSLQEFAEFLGTSVATLKRWESGKSVPTEARQEAAFEVLQGAKPTEPNTESLHPGWLIRIERLSAELSVRSAADQCGIPSSAWHRYETGESALGRKQADRLAATLTPKTQVEAYVPRLSGGEAPAHQQMAIEAPKEAARRLVRELLKSRAIEAESRLRSFEEFQSLAIALMHMGDHDFSGKAYRLATLQGRAAGVPQDQLASVHVGAAWIGFPSLKERALAANRLRWIDNKVMALPAGAQGGFVIMRAMFLDWAGCPNLAHELIRLSAKDELQVLSLAWMEAKYGQVEEALRIAGDFVDNESPKLRFIANKVMLESLLLTNELERARESLDRLQTLRTTFGFWSPDLANRSQRLAL